MVHGLRQFLHWVLVGLWGQILVALNDRGVIPGALQVIDGAVVRTRHQVASPEGRRRDWASGVRAAASRPSPTSASMLPDCR